MDMTGPMRETENRRESVPLEAEPHSGTEPNTGIPDSEEETEIDMGCTGMELLLSSTGLADSDALPGMLSQSVVDSAELRSMFGRLQDKGVRVVWYKAFDIPAPRVAEFASTMVKALLTWVAGGTTRQMEGGGMGPEVMNAVGTILPMKATAGRPAGMVLISVPIIVRMNAGMTPPPVVEVQFHGRSHNCLRDYADGMKVAPKGYVYNVGFSSKIQVCEYLRETYWNAYGTPLLVQIKDHELKLPSGWAKIFAVWTLDNRMYANMEGALFEPPPHMGILMDTGELLQPILGEWEAAVEETTKWRREGEEGDKRGQRVALWYNELKGGAQDQGQDRGFAEEAQPADAKGSLCDGGTEERHPDHEGHEGRHGT